MSTATVPVDTAATGGIQGRTITTSGRAVPNFSAMTAGKAMFGMMGALAMITAGNEIIRTDHVHDPADYISSRLATDLAQKHGGTVVDNNGTVRVVTTFDGGAYTIFDGTGGSQTGSTLLPRAAVSAAWPDPRAAAPTGNGKSRRFNQKFGMR